MAGIDKSTARATAVIALLFATAWALRGYLPGTEPVADRERPTSSPAALVVDVALVGISVAIIGFAIITRLRDRQERRPAPGSLPGGRGAMGRGRRIVLSTYPLEHMAARRPVLCGRSKRRATARHSTKRWPAACATPAPTSC